MIRVGVIGATGYTALELIQILLRHPKAEIVAVTSRENLGAPLDQTHPQLRNRLDLKLEEFDPDRIADKVDFAFCCLPHGASAESVKQLRQRGVRVVDFSADFRLSSLPLYEKWYGVKHPDPEIFDDVPYGLPEFFRESIGAADVVANPGCFPTSAVLGIAPLLSDGWVESKGIVVDAKTGVSGAGRKPGLAFHFPECNESIAAYKVGCHRHQPEISDIVERSTQIGVDCLFTPHLVPMERGILSTIYLRLTKKATEEDLLSCFRERYRDEPFVRVTSDLPRTRDVSGTNFCDLTVRVPGDLPAAEPGSTIIVLSCIDNLIKGASGAAVQNFNLMHSLDETTALLPA